MTGGAAAPELSPRPVRGMGWSDPRAPWLGLPVVLATALVAELSLLRIGVSADGIASDAASGLAFSLAGLIAWHRRPANRSGPIMTAIGFAWFGGDLLFAPLPLIGPLSFGAQAAARVLFAWLLLAFPSGRLESTLHRWAVGLVALMAVGLAIVQLLALDPAALCACPESPVAFAAGSVLTERLDAIGAVVGLGMTFVLVPLVIRRFVIASPPARRHLTPVLAGGGFSLLSVLPQLVFQLTGRQTDAFGWLPLVWIALPIGFLWALLDASMARAAVAELVTDLDRTLDSSPEAGGIRSEPRSRTPTPGVLRLGLLVSGLGLSAIAYVDAASRGFPPDHALIVLVSYSWAYLVAGALGWEARPDSRVGPMMMVIGLVATTPLMAGSEILAIGILPVVGVPLMNSFVIWVVLSYPSGRIASRAYAATAIAVGLAVGITNALARIYGTAIVEGGAVILVCLALWTFGLIIRRLVAATHAARPELTPMIVAGALVALLMTGESLAWILDVNTEFGTPFRWAMLTARVGVPVALLVGLLQRRIAQAAVADLVVDLDVSRLDRLREALSRALRDPTLEVSLWSEEAASYVDRAGQPIALDRDATMRPIVLLQRDGAPLAAIEHDPALSEDPGLLSAVSAAVRMAVDNERLTAAVREQLEQVQASRARIVEAADVERRRVERNLHDGAQQRLVALSLTLRRAQSQFSTSPDAVAGTLSEAAAQLSAALAELRDLARGIHPAILTEAGLEAALRSVARESPVPVDLAVELPEPLPEPVAAAAYFVAAEALANVAKYAGARSVHVSARVVGGELRLAVIDDGVGGADPGRGSGLRGLADRVEALGGGLNVDSQAGRGTRLTAILPLVAPG